MTFKTPSSICRKTSCICFSSSVKIPSRVTALAAGKIWNNRRSQHRDRRRCRAKLNTRARLLANPFRKTVFWCERCNRNCRESPNCPNPPRRIRCFFKTGTHAVVKINAGRIGLLVISRNYGNKRADALHHHRHILRDALGNFGQFSFQTHRLQLAALIVFESVAQVLRDVHRCGERAGNRK